jgi:hypothetical protein
MAAGHRLRALGALTLRKRIFGGFTVVLALLTVLALVGTRGLASVDAGAMRVTRDSTRAATDTELAFEVAEARVHVTQYALSATMDDQKAARDSLAKLSHTIELRTADDGSSLRALGASYINAVDGEMAAIAARRSGIEQMQVAATELGTIVSAIVESRSRSRDSWTRCAASAVRSVGPPRWPAAQSWPAARRARRSRH